MPGRLSPSQNTFYTQCYTNQGQSANLRSIFNWTVNNVRLKGPATFFALNLTFWILMQQVSVIWVTESYFWAFFGNNKRSLRYNLWTKWLYKKENCKENLMVNILFKHQNISIVKQKKNFLNSFSEFKMGHFIVIFLS